ncbi:MAG TPA: sugar ABC transporter substrate-binding protein, partial [Pseudonocardiaceae bacterium]|nr:sugar ABC transporter substrate-binding protein [Pseudonocardiaceae bacterium]
ALVSGNTSAADAIASQTSNDPTGHRTVKSVLSAPESITKDNVKDVVSQGYVKASDICTGAAASVCSSLGIN